jgi:hypothetical protein
MPDFNSFTEFSNHLLRAARTIPKEITRTVENIGAMVEKTAKDKIGYYQQSSGEFDAWESLSESTLKQHVTVGVGDSPLLVHGGLYASVTHDIEIGSRAQKLSVGTESDIGFWQETGTATIPPRPFIGPAMLENEKKIQEMLGQAVERGFAKAL